MKKIFVMLCVAISTPLFAENAEQKEAVLQQFKGSDEPTAIDAAWMSDSSFYVSVKDDGTSRNSYAEYVCLVLYEHGLKGKYIVVRIIDHVAYKKGKLQTLGKKVCD